MIKITSLKRNTSVPKEVRKTADVKLVFSWERLLCYSPVAMVTLYGRKNSLLN